MKVSNLAMAATVLISIPAFSRTLDFKGSHHIEGQGISISVQVEPILNPADIAVGKAEVDKICVTYEGNSSPSCDCDTHVPFTVANVKTVITEASSGRILKKDESPLQMALYFSSSTDEWSSCQPHQYQKGQTIAFGEIKWGKIVLPSGVKIDFGNSTLGEVLKGKLVADRLEQDTWKVTELKLESHVRKTMGLSGTYQKSPGSPSVYFSFPLEVSRPFASEVNISYYTDLENCSQPIPQLGMDVMASPKFRISYKPNIAGVKSVKIKYSPEKTNYPDTGKTEIAWSDDQKINLQKDGDAFVGEVVLAVEKAHIFNPNSFQHVWPQAHAIAYFSTEAFRFVAEVELKDGSIVTDNGSAERWGHYFVHLNGQFGYYPMYCAGIEPKPHPATSWGAVGYLN